MATSLPSGLGTSFGYTSEGTVGTFTTASMRWHKIDSEGLARKKTVAQSQALHQGLFLESKRRNVVQYEAAGNVTMDLVQSGMGLLFQHMLGSFSGANNGVATQLSASSAYKQLHYPADATGHSMSLQLGETFTSGTVQQMNYAGAKVVDWEISVARGQLAKLVVTVDAWDETTTTAYATPTFVSAGVWDFSQTVVKLGGTPSTASNVTSISGGTVPTGLITDIKIKGTNPLKVDRFQLGSQTKKEQLPNHFRQIDIDFTIEWATLADVYTPFANDTVTPLEITFTGGAIPSGAGNNYTLDIIIPAMYIDEAAPTVQGPDVIHQTVKAVGLDNGADNQIQFQYTTTDTAV